MFWLPSGQPQIWMGKNRLLCWACMLGSVVARSTAVKNSFLQIVKSNRARVVTESESHEIHVPNFLLVVVWGLWTCRLRFVSWTCPTCGYQRLEHIEYGILCVRHGSITSALLNADRTGRGDLWAITWLPLFTPRRFLSRGHHVIVMWLFWPIRARLTFFGYPHVSMSSTSMFIAATGRCRYLQIWILELAIPRQSQSQHTWQSFPLHIYFSTSIPLRIIWIKSQVKVSLLTLLHVWRGPVN